MAYTYFTETQLSGTWHYARMGIQVNSQNNTVNPCTSNITVVMDVRERVNATSYNLTGSANFWIKVNGGVVASKTTFDWRTLTTTYVNQLSWTGNVGHNWDGTIAITIQGYIYTGVGAGTWAPAAFDPGAQIPADIPRTATYGSINLSAFEAAFTTNFNYYTGVCIYHIYVGSTFICQRAGVSNGSSIQFSAAELQAIYNAAPGTTVTVTFYLGTFTD